MITKAYFEKARLKSYISLQFMVAVVLFFVALFEGALSHLDLFLFAVPWLSFAIYFVLVVFYPVALPFLSIFIVTILADIFFNSLYHSQTFAILVSLAITRSLLPFAEQRDFLEIWQGFGLAMLIMAGLQSLFFMVGSWQLINLQSVIFQFGVTMLIYPFIHVIVTRLAQISIQASQR
ncbi:MAG: hypothetical protein ACON44_09890 [Candidatus Puniceispirillaceae bacterium]